MIGSATAQLGDFAESEKRVLVLAQIEDLKRTYRVAITKLQAVLDRAASTDFARFRATEQLKQIRAIVASLDVAAKEAADQTIPLAYERGALMAAAALREQGIDAARANMGNRVSTQTAGVLSDQMAADLLQGNASLKRQADRFVRRTQQAVVQDAHLSRLVAAGRAAGETRRQVSEQIRRDLVAALPEGGKIVINGRRFDPAYYAELVARTRSREAATQAAIDSNREWGVDLVQVSYHASACPVCVPFQGKVYSIDGASPGWPRLVERPPYHPNCITQIDTPIETKMGIMPFAAVKIGDEVLTHENRYRRVVAKMERPYSGPTVHLGPLGKDRFKIGPLSLTVNHRVKTADGWVEAGCLTPLTRICTLDPMDRAFFHYMLALQSGYHDGTVYNMEVEEDHSYVAAGIVVKNCAHVLVGFVEVPGREAQTEALRVLSNGSASIASGEDYRRALANGGVLPAPPDVTAVP